MKQINTTNHCNGIFWLLIFFFLSFFSLQAQFVFQNNNSSDSVSIYSKASYVDVGQKQLKLEEVINSKSLKFSPMKSSNTDFGFTKNNYWIKFQLENATNQELLYFLETARPITDLTELYTIKSNGDVSKFKSGDAIPYYERSFDHRKTIFKIVLQPKETQQFYIHVKSDGEVLSMPMVLHSTEDLIRITSFEQIVFGFFYGILAITAILYLFFFFAMREKTFLYYSLYVVFIGLLQFSVDGYFFQFITPNSGWLSLHSVIISATIANFLLGRYAQVFLKIHQYSKIITTAFMVLYALDFLLLLSLFFVPNALEYSYPIANGLGLVLLILIIASLTVIYIKSKKIDRYFATGIFFLISGFVIFILKNFSVLPLTFLTENSSKLGTGLEVVFLSLSMANLIRNLKNDREALQTLALQRSEEMNELKSYFLSNISHELRTPLNAIMSLTDATATETNENTIKNNCEIIKNSSQSLLNSVNDILDFSKIEKGELKLETSVFEPIKVLEQVKNNAALLAKEQGLHFVFTKSNDIPEYLIGDAARLSQMANNILQNAIKFTEDGTVKFHLDFKIARKNEIDLLLTVSDTGIGIPKEKINSIFDSFTQESINNKRKFGGLGLGLYIVKSLVDLHHGTAEMISEVGFGTICKIKLRYTIAVQEKKAVSIVVDSEYDLKGKRILVVEDNAMNQMVIKMITKKWLNTSVEFANNGEIGVNMLKNNSFDIVLMDLQMPIMDGYEATIAIRNGEAGETNRNIPIIAVTADVMESTKERVVEIGMNHYLSKPVDKDSLYKNILALL